MADKRFGTYYKLLADVLRDLKVTEAELAYVKEKQVELELLPEQVKAIHAKVFAAAIIPMIDDDFLDPMEEDKLIVLKNCLSKLGWAPGVQSAPEQTPRVPNEDMATPRQRAYLRYMGWEGDVSHFTKDEASDQINRFHERDLQAGRKLRFGDFDDLLDEEESTNL